MAGASGIEWTDATWNPVTGCNKISPGCKHCYAERMAKRLLAMGSANYKNGFALTLQPHALEIPLGWKRSRMVFVNSMSDLFHKDVPLTFIQQVFEVMNRADWHTFQILTKRPERALELSPRLCWSKNIWMGTSIESNKYVARAESLRQIPAHVRFLSLEPLLGPLPDLALDDIHWAIVGGESGPGARPMQEEWVKQLRDLCLGAKVPFFFKQWGGVNKKKAGRLLEGRTWDDLPGAKDARAENKPPHQGPQVVSSLVPA